jgi:diguanylate cyclase (GGDEF)-like protein/PAS domain S-box-containing protein
MDDVARYKEIEGDLLGLLSFLYLCPAGLLQTDLSGAVKMANPLAAQLLIPLGETPALENLFDCLQPYSPELRNIVADFNSPRGMISENLRIFLNKSWAEPKVLSLSLMRIDADCLMAVLTDISTQVKQERLLKQTEAWFDAIFAGVNDFAFFTLDRDGAIDTWNSSCSRQTGFGEEDVMGRKLDCLFAAESNAKHKLQLHLDAARREGWHMDDGRCVRKDLSLYWSHSLVAALREENGEVCGFSVVLRDITERRLNAEEVRRLLTTDHLTGAANRARLLEAAESEINKSRRYRTPLSAIMLDLDHFKRINDTGGHAAGDEVLIEAVRRCRAILRSFDTIARMGGEEFVILLPGTAAAGAVEIAELIRVALADMPFITSSKPFAVTASLGCATLEGRSMDIDGLLRNADEALYRAKKLGRNRVVSHDWQSAEP